MRTAARVLPFAFCFVASLSAADDKPEKLTIATWNVEWFYDANTDDNFSDLSKEQSAPSRDEWEWKLTNVANVIAKMKPDILALQEVENRFVVRQLTKQLSDRHGIKYRIAFIQGWDNFTEQDVAIIYRSGLVEYSCREQTSEMFESKHYYNLNKHLFARFKWGSGKDAESLIVLNVHLRALAEKHDIREKQVQLMRKLLEKEIQNGENIVVIGDMNTEQHASEIANGSEMAFLSGWDSKNENDDLLDLNQFLQPDYRATYLSGQQYDRILVSQSMFNNDKRKKKDLMFSRIANFRDLVVVGTKDVNHFNEFYKIPRDERDYSDHYPVMAEFEFK